MGPVRLHVRRHRLLRDSRLPERPHLDRREAAGAQGSDDRHGGGAGATIALGRSLSFRGYSIPLMLLPWYAAVEAGWVGSRLLLSPARVWTELVAEIGNGTLVFHT